MSDSFMDLLINWKEFELFIKRLYEQDEELDVEHDVTLTGKSNAKRQIDVLIKHKTLFHEYITIVECKRWKHRVDRSRVDILYAAMDDLNASKGVIFTTVGYEKGALEYAKSKNIDLFLVRDLKSEEWGLPGRNINFFIQTYCGKLDVLNISDTKLHLMSETYPKDLSIDIVLSENGELDERYYLYSKYNKCLHCFTLVDSIS